MNWRLFAFTRCVTVLVLLVAVPVICRAQAAPGGQTLAIAGMPGQAPVVQVNGRSYVDIEALARLTQGSISFRGMQTILTLPGSTGGASATDTGQPKQGFSPAFLRAGIEEMTVIREWRIALVNAVQNNTPVSEDWVGGFRRTADSKLALASAAATTASDRNAFQLLGNEFRNMQQLSDQFLALRSTVSYVAPNSFDNNPLDAKVLGCARALAAMAAANQFQDEPACH